MDRQTRVGILLILWVITTSSVVAEVRLPHDDRQQSNIQPDVRIIAADWNRSIVDNGHSPEVGLFHAAPLHANPAARDNSAAAIFTPFEFSHGRLSYRKKNPSGYERGREFWWHTQNRDGSRTMRVLAMTDDSEFVRDVIYVLDANERPLRVHIELQVGEQLVGSGYFQVSGDSMTVVTDGVGTGHTVQVVAVPPRFHVLTHAVMLDGWPTWAFVGEEAGTQTIDVYTTSPLWNGTTGPLGHMTTQNLTLVGTEQITVPAGTFEARHFSFGGESDPANASHVWVTGEHNILLKYDWPPYGMEYVLESLVIESQRKQAGSK